MRIFYEEWQCLSIGSPLVNQLQQLENKTEEGVEIGEKSAERLQGRRIKLRCPPKVLTDTLHPIQPSIFSS